MELSMPGKTLAGSGCILKIGSLAEELGCKNACLILDAALENPEFKSIIIKNLEDFGIGINYSTVITSEPTLKLLQELSGNDSILDCDLIIAIGGGSTLDTGKLLPAAATNPVFARDIRNSSAIEKDPLPFIAVPTTAGTGAEATPNAILLDELTHEKTGIISTKMIPDIVLLDGDLTRRLPFPVAVSTGFDALSHALESCTSKRKNDFTSLFALEFIRIIFSHLEDACINNCGASRQKMLEASFYAGVCLTTSSTHVVHAMAYPLSARYGIRHGSSISTLLPPVMKALRPRCVEYFSEVGKRCLDLQPGISDEQASVSLINKIYDMAEHLSVPADFSRFGVKRKDIGALSREAVKIKRLFDNSPACLSGEEIQKIYKEVI